MVLIPKPLPYHRVATAITSWFRLPAQGMMNHEMLCRGTAFATRVANHPKLFFITCSHVAAPWRWPELYPIPWLKCVNEEHTRCVLHVTESKTGRVLDRLPMKTTAIHHDQLDVCVMQLEDEEEGLRRMDEYGLKLEALEIMDEIPRTGQQVVCCGYAVERQEGEQGESKSSKPSSKDDDDDDFLQEEEEEMYESSEIGGGEEEVMTLALATDREARHMCVSLGEVNQYRDRLSRGFARMDYLLLDGVCGAPMLDLASRKCIGMVEGVVPAAEQEVVGREGPEAEVRRAIAGNAGFIYGQELKKLLNKAAGSSSVFDGKKGPRID